MAKLDGGFGFTGSIGNISAYKMRGSDKVILRSKGGPSKNKIKRSPNFESTRRNNMEFGGRSTMAKWVMRGLGPHKSALADYNIAGSLQPLLKPVQNLDTTNEWGHRHVQLSKDPKILEGFSLNKKYIFDSVIRSPVPCQLLRQELSAVVKLPALRPGINFFSTAWHPLFSISICLAIVPDVFFEAKGYKVGDDYEQFYPKNIRTPWFALTKGCEEQTMELKLKNIPPDENFSLMLSVGINYGVIESPGEITQAKYAGSAKVLTMA
jgi:hypothetical protein